jgi:gliding motility-associated-like protein
MRKAAVYSVLLVVFGTLSIRPAFSQLLTNNSQTPPQLVQNVLLGTGVCAFNITYNGDANAIGFFNGVNTNIGLDSGIVMTTGSIFAPNGPPGPNAVGSAGVDNFQPGDAYLTNLCGSPTFNAAILEFDFIPQSDTVRFRYVFGSEEYPEFVGSYNDAFAFVLSGVSTPMAPTNIALIPGTPTPITINNVSNGTGNAGPCVNCGYYVDNLTNPGQTIQYDGFTTVLTAEHAVICGQTYHIKLAIADAIDGIYDSGVFLEANSFSSPGIGIDSDVDLGYQGNDSTLFEGCGQAILTFTLNCNVARGDTIHFLIGGNAINGVDYPWLADSIVFPPGQGTVQLIIQALQDNVWEGTDTLKITTIPSGCGVDSSVFYVYISDMPLMAVNAGPDDSLVCPGQTATLNAVAIGGLPGYAYTWDNGLGAGQTHVVQPAVTTTYIVQATDTCNQQVVSDTITIWVIPYIPPQAIASADVQLVCPGQATTLTAIAVNGTPNYRFTWSTGDQGNFTTVAPNATTVYYVTVLDSCGSTGKDSVTVTVIPYVPMTVSVSNDTSVCPGEPVFLKASATGGVPKVKGGNPYYDFDWGGDSLKNTRIIARIANGYQVVSVTDSCNNVVKDSVFIGIVTPAANYTIEYITDFDIQFLDSSYRNIVKWDWDFGDGSHSAQKNPVHTFGEVREYTIKLVATNDLGCSDSIVKTIVPPMYIYVPSAFSPNGDGRNDFFFGKGIGMLEYELLIFDRWGEHIFTSTNSEYGWNGNWQGNPCQEGVYIYKIKAKGYKGRFEKVGTVTLVR